MVLSGPVSSVVRLTGNPCIGAQVSPPDTLGHCPQSHLPPHTGIRLSYLADKKIQDTL